MNESYPVELSIVVPLYNEEECVEALFQEIKTELEKLGRTHEIILVDDGSKDRTVQKLLALKQSAPNLRVIQLRKNYGQTPAMAAGFDHARGKIIITMDGDRQNNPADIKSLLSRMEEGYDVVSGWRYKRKDAFLTRTLPSRIANALISHFTGTRLHDYGCSLKAYKSNFVKPLHFYSDMHRFFPAIVSALAGGRTSEIAVDHRPRTTGKSKYGLSRIFKVIADLITIQLITQFSKKPVYWFGLAALPFLILACLMVGAAGWLYLRHPSTMEFSIVIPGVAFLTAAVAFHFIVFGVLAEYIVSTGDYNDSSTISVKSI